MARQERTALRVALSTGGTGGHVFPALSLAEELKRRGYSVSWCTDQRGAEYLSTVTEQQSDRLTFYIARDSGGILGKIKQLTTIISAVLKVLFSFLRQRPNLIVGFGGYTTAPVVIAAKLLGIPIALHEQNAVLGKVNRWMGRYAKVMALGFEKTQRLPAALKTVYVGNPVRAEIMQLRDKEFPPLTDKINVLVIGGSQGTALFSEVIPEAVALLPQDLKDRLHLTQQARKELLGSTRKAYQELGVSAHVEPFFEDIARLYAQAHLVICRAGAMTVAEVCAARKAAIFIPLAIAMDNHQYFNAQELVQAGLAQVINEKDMASQILAAQLRKFLKQPSQLQKISQKLQEKYSNEATVRLANCLEDLLPKE